MDLPQQLHRAFTRTRNCLNRTTFQSLSMVNSMVNSFIDGTPHTRFDTNHALQCIAGQKIKKYTDESKHQEIQIWGYNTSITVFMYFSNIIRTIKAWKHRDSLLPFMYRFNLKRKISNLKRKTYDLKRKPLIWFLVILLNQQVLGLGMMWRREEDCWAKSQIY